MNELNQYRQILRRLLPIVVPLALVGLVAGSAYSLTQPKAWEASATLYVHRSGAPTPVNVYDYDGYYSQQAAQQYTDTVIGLLKTQDIATRATQLVAEPADTASKILQSVQVKKTAPQLISLTVDRPTADEAKKDLVALAQAVDERSSSLNDQAGRTYKVELVTGQPLVGEASNNLMVNSGVGVAGGALLGLLLAFAAEYLRR